MAKKRLLLRLVGRVLAAIALAATFVAALVLGIALHLDSPGARRLVGRGATRALSTVFMGKLEIAPLDRISLREVRVAKATLDDVYGRRVVTLSDVRIGFDPILIVKELLAKTEVFTLDIRHVRAEKGDAEIVSDPTTGEPTIAGAVAPRPSATPSGESGSGRSVQLLLPNIEVGSVTLRAALRDVPPLEADLHEVRGQLAVAPTGIAVDVTRLEALFRGFGTEAQGIGTLSIHVPGAVRGTFDGSLGGIALGASALLRDGHVELSLDIPGAAPAVVRRFLPDWPLEEPVSAHAEVNGDLPELRPRARFTLGTAVVTVEGLVALGEKRHATLAFSGADLDARVFSARAPSTHVALHGNIDAESENGKFSARIRAHTGETEVGGYPVPAFDAEAIIGDGTVSGTADIHEAGLPTHATFRVGRDGAVDVEIDAKAVDFGKVRSASSRGVAGRGVARLRAHLEGGNLNASLDGTIGVVDVASIRVSDARISAQVRGPVAFPENLQVAAHLAVQSLRRGDYALENLEFDARGNLAEAAFDARVRQSDGPEIALAGKLALLRHPLLRDTIISLKRDKVLIEATISEFDPASATFYLRDIRTTGAGGPLTGSARLSPDLIEIEAEGDNVDLDALSHALALPRGTLGGRARVSLRLAAGRKAARGHVRVAATHLTFGLIGGVDAELFVDLDGGQLTGAASGVTQGLGAFGASWNVALPSSALELTSLRGATGTAELQLNDADLAWLARLFPAGSPVEKVEGRVYAKIEIVRGSTQAILPSVKLTAVTRGLAVDLRGSGKGERKRIAGIDLIGSATFDGDSGETSGNTALLDAHGGLASIAGSVKVDVPRLVKEPEHALSRLIDAPVDVRASVPLRRISNLPAILDIEGVDGDIGGEVFLEGTIAHPTLRGSFDGRGIVVEGSPLPIEVHADAQYDHVSSELHARGEAKLAKESVATATLAGTLPGEKSSDFQGTLQLDLNGLPFDVIGALADNNVRGRVFGTAKMSKLGADGALLADFRIAEAVVDRTPLGEGKLHIATDGAIVNASATFSGGHGRFDAEGKAGLKWSGPIPSLSPEVPARGRLVTKDFSLAPLSPLTTGVLSRVGGRLDANVTVALDPEIDEEHRVRWDVRADGSAVLQDGTAVIDLLGTEIRDIGMSIKADGKGNTTRVSVAQIKGRVRSTADNVHGSADIEFEGLKLVRGSASINAKNMPLLFHGTPQGRVTGDVSLRLTNKPEQVLVDVEVPTLKLTLPEASSRKVIDVADNAEVTILQSEVPAESSGPSSPMKVSVHLGSAVVIHRSDIEVKIRGTPVIDLGSDTQVTGSIEIVPGGRIPALGQVFVIDRGLVTFDTGAPDNPTVNVVAEWRAPNNTFVFVQVTGKAKDVQVSLRSEPPLPEREVFALLFGGSSADPTSADRRTGEEGSAARTAAMQGPVSQLNRLFGQSPVELRVGSTSESKPRYTAAVRIRENLWFEASTYKQTQDATGATSDQSVVSGTIDYRFSRKWSLRTELGTMGGALDLLWQRRY